MKNRDVAAAGKMAWGPGGAESPAFAWANHPFRDGLPKDWSHVRANTLARTGL